MKHEASLLGNKGDNIRASLLWLYQNFPAISKLFKDEDFEAWDTELQEIIDELKAGLAGNNADHR